MCFRNMCPEGASHFLSLTEDGMTSRKITAVRVSDLVRAVHREHKIRVEVLFFADPRILEVRTVGREQNHLFPGHYILIDHATTGEDKPVSFRFVPAETAYSTNDTVDEKFIGTLLDVSDENFCSVFHLTPRAR